MQLLKEYMLNHNYDIIEDFEDGACACGGKPVLKGRGICVLCVAKEESA